MANSPSLLAGVIGWPVSHSLSPRLHGYWLKEHKINGSYTAMAVEPGLIKEAIKTLADKHFRGVNITVPHKEAVLGLLDHIDEAAQAIGAVNTIVIKDGRLHGSNTDAYGFLENIRPHLPKRKEKAVVLGAGGAARGVCYALSKAGFKSIVVTNRTRERAEEIAALCECARTAPWEKRSQILDDADLLVNTTSLGMAGMEPLDVDVLSLPKHALVTDIVYRPLLTPLLKNAQARGNPTVDGLGMLMYQAVPGFEAWFGKTPSVTPKLRTHLLEART